MQTFLFLAVQMSFTISSPSACGRIMTSPCVLCGNRAWQCFGFVMPCSLAGVTSLSPAPFFSVTAPLVFIPLTFLCHLPTSSLYCLILFTVHVQPSLVSVSLYLRLVPFVPCRWIVICNLVYYPFACLPVSFSFPVVFWIHHLIRVLSLVCILFSVIVFSPSWDFC